MGECFGGEGIVIVFTRARPGAYNEATDSWSAPTSTAIPGEGILMSGDPEEFAAQELILSTTPVIGFTPSVYPLRAFTPEFVMPSDSVQINGETFTVVKILKVVAPDGFVIYSRIAVTR